MQDNWGIASSDRKSVANKSRKVILAAYSAIGRPYLEGCIMF